ADRAGVGRWGGPRPRPRSHAAGEGRAGVGPLSSPAAWERAGSPIRLSLSLRRSEPPDGSPSLRRSELPPGSPSLRRRGKGGGRHSLLLCLLIVLVMPGLTGCRTKRFLSTRQEVGLGKEAARQVEQELRVDTSSPDAERVRRVGASLLAHMDRRDVPYSFKVLDAKEINAFSLPGGPVYVFRGLLDMMGDDDDALACVLGHECAHINARHAARQISSQFATNILIGLAIPTATGQNLAGL